MKFGAPDSAFSPHPVPVDVFALIPLGSMQSMSASDFSSWAGSGNVLWLNILTKHGFTAENKRIKIYENDFLW